VYIYIYIYIYIYKKLYFASLSSVERCIALLLSKKPKGIIPLGSLTFDISAHKELSRDMSSSFVP
jgi:hypothetical protein